MEKHSEDGSSNREKKEKLIKRHANFMFFNIKLARL